MLPTIITLNKELVPIYSTSGSACFDIFCPQSVTLPSKKITYIPLELYLMETTESKDTSHTDTRFLLQLAARSSLIKRGILVLGGVIDQDYRSEILGTFFNNTDSDVQLHRGDRILQAYWVQTVAALGVRQSTEDRTGGFGSTGI